MLGLSTLALRRTLPAWLLVALVGLLLLAARSGGGAPLLQPDERALAGLRALARQNVWSVLFVLAPLLFVRAARLGAPAANAWLAPAPSSRGAIALALALGCLLACAAATGVTALVSEAATAGAGRAWRRARTLENPPAVLLDTEPRVRWSVPRPAAGQRLRLATTVAVGSGPAVTARFTVRAGALSSAVEARVPGRMALELEAPEGAGDVLELELERIGTGALLVLPPRALELLTPVASERLTALALGARAFVFLATGCTLALGLASRMRASLAAGLVLALALLSWTRARAARFVPAADLPRAWRELGEGLVPEWAPPSELVGALALFALGLALFARAPLARESPR
jgi:hypothetical protein